MRRSIWFRRRGLHWTPCAWQGWALVALFTLCVLLVVTCWAPRAPLAATAGTLAMTALLIGIAARTDDSRG